MKLRWKLFVFSLILVLPALACGNNSTNAPTISTSIPLTNDTSTTNESEPIEESSQEEVPTDEPESEPIIAVTESPTEEPTPEPTDTPEPVQEANLGDLVEQDGYSFAAVTVNDPATPGILFSPVEGEKLIAVEVVIGNVSAARITVNVLNATLLDNDGFTYQPELGGIDNQLDLVDLEPGQRVKGWIPFSIPESATAAKIKYEARSFPDTILQSKLTTLTGESVANPDIPLTASGQLETAVYPPIGEVVENEGYSLVVEAVENPTTPGLLYDPTDGMKLVAIQIIVGNVSGEVITVNALNTYLLDSDGYIYTAELAGRNEQIELVDLNVDERVRGWVAFEIPEDATPASVIYQVSGFPLIELQAGLLE